MKHYNSVYECVLLESSSEEEFRRVLALAREKVLLLEGRQARLCHVVQLLADQSDVFVAVNGRIAKAIGKIHCQSRRAAVWKFPFQSKKIISKFHRLRVPRRGQKVFWTSLIFQKRRRRRSQRRQFLLIPENRQTRKGNRTRSLNVPVNYFFCSFEN